MEVGSPSSAPRGSPPRCRRAGFTLLELLVVIVILGILGALAGVVSGDRSEQMLRLAEVHVRDALERARGLAIARRGPVGVVFDPEGERFAVVDESGATIVDPLRKRDYVVEFDHPNQPLRVEILAADFGATGTAAVFDAQGVPLAAGSVTIGQRGSSRTLVLDEATGRVSTP